MAKLAAEAAAKIGLAYRRMSSSGRLARSACAMKAASIADPMAIGAITLVEVNPPVVAISLSP